MGWEYFKPTPWNKMLEIKENSMEAVKQNRKRRGGGKALIYWGEHWERKKKKKKQEWKEERGHHPAWLQLSLTCSKGIKLQRGCKCRRPTSKPNLLGIWFFSALSDLMPWPMRFIYCLLLHLIEPRGLHTHTGQWRSICYLCQAAHQRQGRWRGSAIKAQKATVGVCAGRGGRGSLWILD